MSKKIKHFVLFYFIITSLSFAQVIYKITVFDDENKNQIFDANEKPLEGVSVSNQYTTVKTDKKGICELSLSANDFIFVVKPANYQVPLNEYNMPIFYNKYNENSKYGIEVKGKSKNELYFPLYKTDFDENFSTLILGDPQSRNEIEIAYMRDDFVSKFVNANYKFAILLGDIVYDNKTLYELSNKVFSKMNIPLYFVAGNHDLDYDADNDRLAFESFKEVYGPVYYSFEYGNVHFVVLDNINYKKSKDGKRDYVGEIDKQQLNWLKSDLDNTDKNKTVVISMHIPVNSVGGDYDANKILNKDEFFDILDSRDKVILLCGHTHTQEHNFYYTKSGKEIRQYICGAVCGSWWSGLKDFRGIPFSLQLDGTPRGYNILEFNGPNYKQMYYPLNYAKDYQTRLSVKKIDESLFCYANVFNGNKFTKVTFNLDSKLDLQGDNVTMGDNLVDDMIKNNSTLFKSWMHAENTSHIWVAKLPSDLEKGLHTLIATVIDEYGNKFKDRLIFEVQ